MLCYSFLTGLMKLLLVLSNRLNMLCLITTVQDKSITFRWLIKSMKTWQVRILGIRVKNQIYVRIKLVAD
jgi:hypothetical protein